MPRSHAHSYGLGVVMSNDWPRGWYSDERDRPGAAGQRPQPRFTPSSQGHGAQGQGSPGQGAQGQGSPGEGWHDVGTWGNGAAGASGNAWPAQPPSRSSW